MVIGEMGELPPTRHIADGVDAPIGGLESVIDHDPAAVASDTGLLEREAVGVRFAAGRDQEMAAFDRRLALADDHLDLCIRAFDARHRDVAADVNALARERVEHDRRAFAVLARERLSRLQHRDRGAEAAKSLSELEADGARADDDQVLRPRGEIEHGFVGKIGHSLEPRDRRKRRR